MKKIKALCYTKGHFGKNIREILDTDNKNLYSMGRYPTKIVKEDLPEYYIEFSSRTIWYMTGYLKTAGVVDIEYKATKINHLFKDDYLYISYKEKLKSCQNRWGLKDYMNYDICICGNSIVPILLYIEKYSDFNIDKIKEKIYGKIKWLKENYENEYNQFFANKDTDIFQYYKNKMLNSELY